MKKAIVLGITLILSGCYNRIHNYEIDAAMKLCENNKGVNRINLMGERAWVRCNDGFIKELEIKGD